MAWRRHSIEDVLTILREVAVQLYDGLHVASVPQGGDFGKNVLVMGREVWLHGRPQQMKMKAPQKENDPPKEIVADHQFSKVSLAQLNLCT